MSIVRRIANVFSRSKVDREIRRELALHLAMRVEDNMAAGMSAKDARRDALVRFGNPTVMRERTTQADAALLLESVWGDVSYSLRQLRRSPGFALTTILTLTMAIAANVVVYGVVNALILHPLPVEEPRQIYQIQGRSPSPFVVSYPNYRDIRDLNQTFSAVAATRVQPMGIGVNGIAQTVWGYEVSGNYFSMLGIRPYLGRFFTQADDVKVNGSPVVVLSYDCWKVRYNRDAGIIGKIILISKHPYTVVAIAPENFTGTERFLFPEVWVPYHDAPDIEGMNTLEYRRDFNSWLIGRLKPGVTEAQANADLQRVAGLLAQQHPDDNKGLGLKLSKPGLLGDLLGGPVRAFLAGVMAMAVLVLLAACANLGVLFSSRMSDRAKELGIRLAIGSSRARILRQLLTESVLIALIGGVVASGASAILLKGLTNWRPAFAELPMHFLADPDWTVFAFSVLLALLTGILFGVIPARQVWKADPNETLKSAGSTAAGGDRSILRSILLAVQIALCCLLVTSSFVALRGLERTFHMPMGFSPEGITLASLDVHAAGYSGEQEAAIQRRLYDSVAAIPGVTQAAYADTTPLSIDSSSTDIYPPGTKEFVAANIRLDASHFKVSPGYFATTGTRLLAGREFTVHDDAKAPHVAVVNETFARRLFGVDHAADAVGKRYPTGPKDETEVVGVVEDGKYVSLTEAAKPAYFESIVQSSSHDTVLLVKSKRETREVAATMRRAISEVDSSIAVSHLASWTDTLGLATFPARAATIALGVLGALAIMLAVTGIFGLASYTVSRRMRELGIRVALGAGRRQMLRAALGRTLLLLVVGSAAGLLLGFAASRLLAGVVYQATASDPLVVVAVVLTMIGLGLVSAALPARRAMRIDPMALLREK